MRARIERYKQIEQCKRIGLEEEYKKYIEDKDYDNAYNTLGKLVDYKLLALTDYRLQPNCKEISKRSIDKKHNFKTDIRTSSEYVAQWLCADLPTVMNSKITKCKSIERNVNGDTKYEKILPELDIDVKMELQTTRKGVTNCIDAIANMYTSQTKREFTLYNSISADAQANAVQVYKVTTSLLVNQMYRELGYIIVFMGKDNKVHFSMILNINSFENLNVNLREATLQFRKTILQSLKAEHKVNFLVDYDNFIVKQKADMEKTLKECEQLKNKMRAVTRATEIEKEQKEIEKKERLRVRKEKAKEKALKDAEKNKKVVV